MTKYSALLLLVLLVACGKSNAPKPTGDSTTAGKDSSGMKAAETTALPEGSGAAQVYSGKLGDKLNITVRVSSGGGSATGTYFYSTVGEDIKLTGTVDGGGNMILNEFDTKGNQTGVFKGTISGDNFAGSWSKPDGTAQMPFSLAKAPETGGPTPKISFHELKEDSKEKLYHILVQYPELSGYTNMYTQNKINAMIHHTAVTTFNQAKKDYGDAITDVTPEQFKDMSADARSEFEFKATTDYNDNGVVSFAFQEYSYALGAAHPNSDETTLNYDLLTGKQIKLEDLFAPGAKYVEVITQHSNKDILAHMKQEVQDAEFTEESIPEFTKESFVSFTFQKTGLHFYLGEIMSHAAGFLESDVPYPALKSMVKPGSPLARVVR